MDSVFVYWDNSNIFHEAQRFAVERNEGPDACYRVRINFENMLRLAHADRPLERALAAGSVPPEMRHLWNRVDGLGEEARRPAGSTALRGSGVEAPGALSSLRESHTLPVPYVKPGSPRIAL